MACEVPTRSGRSCSHFAKHTLNMLEDGITYQMRCCSRHRDTALRVLVNDSETHFGHGVRMRQKDEYINSIVTVDDVPYPFGVVAFGPETERQHLERVYDTYQDEFCRIGMFGLQNEDPTWRLKYEECKHHMRMIEFRLDWLP